MRIGIDAMGGDFAPEVAIKGAIMALDYLAEDTTVVLFGDCDIIHSLLNKEGCDSSRIEIVATEEVIEMGDHAVKAFRQKSNSSIVVGFNHLAEGHINAFASAGSTGAMMVGAMQLNRDGGEIERPAIASVIPSITGASVVILDLGLNVDCKPRVLDHYAKLGAEFATRELGVKRPRVALLNIGKEPTKGNMQARSAYKVMQTSGEEGEYNFVGNIEASHLFTAEVADVVVCDGFVGNIVLKLMEGLYAINHKCGTTNSFWDGMDYEVRGGSPILGCSAPVVIGHGRSTAKAICNMILTAERHAK